MVESAADKLVSENTGLVHACCRRFAGRGIEYDDLYQSGCMGLVKAARGFDPGRGLQFSTYAVPVILGEIKRLFRDGGSVKLSRSLKELSYKAARRREEWIKTRGREPTLSELAAEFSVTAEEIGEALCAAQPVQSLTFRDEEGEHDLPVSGPDEIGELTESLALRDALGRLEEADARLIRYRYYAGKTQSETATLLGMTQVQVSRREKYIFKELRRILQG
ncbi:MAG: sigma-70 family RNA polymerase sigma factor [Candidatus Howiella sp.]|jgi:RNA polymerase sporulation-specific sigma factor